MTAHKLSLAHDRDPVPERDIPPDLFRRAMRAHAGGVAVVTTGAGPARTGFTATSVSSLSAEPPRVLVCVALQSSSWPVLRRDGRFAVNLLAEGQEAIADRFAGRNGETGAERYVGASWKRLATGACGLEDARVVLDCELEEAIERHSHAILIGRVRAVEIAEKAGAPLIYADGRYRFLASGPAS